MEEMRKEKEKIWMRKKIRRRGRRRREAEMAAGEEARGVEGEGDRKVK
jgi:hypothetical protein